MFIFQTFYDVNKTFKFKKKLIRIIIKFNFKIEKKNLKVIRFFAYNSKSRIFESYLMSSMRNIKKELLLKFKI